MKPLFERLSCQSDALFAKSFTVEDLKVSIVNEVRRITATRHYGMSQSPALQDRTILDYGIPSVVSLGKYDLRCHEIFAAEIRQAIANFEPRLADVQVEMEASRNKYAPLRFLVKGILNLAHASESFQFAMDLADNEAHH